MSDIQETINRLRELDQEASPAPWEAWGFGEDEQTSIEHPMGDVLERGERGYGHMREDTTWFREADADLITETRNALPALLTEIDRLTAENAKAWEEGYKTAANTYYDDLSEPDEFAQEARMNNPYQEKK